VQAGGKVRKPGMQPGAKGSTLETADTPDVVVVHTPEVGSGCGGDLADAELMGGGAGR